MKKMNKLYTKKILVIIKQKIKIRKNQVVKNYLHRHGAIKFFFGTHADKIEFW